VTIASKAYHNPKSGASANSATFAALLDYTKQVFVQEVFSDLSNYKA
jgi:glycine/serine hydroxymethyltransferase